MRRRPLRFLIQLINTQNQLRRNEALFHRFIAKRNFYTMKETNQRFRTIIQLGELLVESGLVEKAKIPLGVDLKNDQQAKDKADKLLQFLKAKCGEFS